MNIALLNTRVTFQKQEAVIDDIGNHVNSWADHFTCAATISGEGGSETYQAAETNEKSDISVTVRWCKTTAEIKSSGYRVLFDGEIYDILSVDHFSYKKDAVKFRCIKVKR